MFFNDAHRRIFSETESIPGWQLPEDSEALFELGYKSGDVILEIGTYAGRSAVCMIEGARSAGRIPIYYGIDISSHAISMTAATLKNRKLISWCLLHEGTLAGFFSLFRARPTCVFVDGGHEYEDVAADIALLQKIVRPSTPIIFHDYQNPDTPGVKRAVDEACERSIIKIYALPGCCAAAIAIDTSGRADQTSRAEFILHSTQKFYRDAAQMCPRVARRILRSIASRIHKN